MTATKTQALPRATPGDRLIRLVFWWRRLRRMWFPSPAEAQFVRVMRGHVLTVPFIKSRRTGFPLAIVWRGKILKGELIEREVWVGGSSGGRRYCLDFATRDAAYRKALEIDGSDWHRDVLREQERDEYLRAHGWQVMHIKARRLWREPRVVYVETLRHLRS